MTLLEIQYSGSSFLRVSSETVEILEENNQEEDDNFMIDIN